MASSRQKLATLAALILVLAGVLWWQTGREASPLPPPSASLVPAPVLASPVAAAAPPARASQKVPAVALVRLRGERPGVVDSGRDPFRFGAAPRPPVVERQSDRGPTSSQDRGDGDGSAGGGTAAAGNVPPPPITLKFIGVVKRSEAGIVLAVLSDGKGVYYGSEGDVIEGRYRILTIGRDSVEMAYLDGRGRQRIPLSGA